MAAPRRTPVDDQAGKEATAVVPEEQHFILSTLSPGPAQKRLAFAVVLGILVVFVLITAGPLKGVQLGRVDAFVPAYVTAMFAFDSITAILLYAQFSILRSRATLVIASGYLFTALILIPFILVFPGVFVPGNVMGGMQSTSWLYFLQHAGFPLFVICYALSKDADPSKQIWQGTVRAAITQSVALTAVLVLAVAFLCIAGEALLPRVTLDSRRLSPLWPYVGAPVALLSLSAIVLLWIWRRSALDLWLMVVMFLYSIEIPLSYYPDPARFSVGWYTVRVFGILSSSLVLVVLLYEIETLYSRLLSAVLAQRRERQARLMTGDAVAASIAHEVKQPLTAMVTTADAGLRFLDRTMPNLDRAKEAFKQISADGHRAGAVVDSIRANFRNDEQTRTSLDLNELIQEALALERGNLQKHRILVQAEPNKQLPEVRGNRVQLQQVLLNLITNAIDAMAAKDEPRVLSVKSEAHEGDGVMISVADTGTGIGSQDAERIFNPLFTTKSDGMGMGLSICRAIIEAHEGRLWVTPNTPRGAVFQFTLHADNPVSVGA
jgi:signal transduction histidine kinase